MNSVFPCANEHTFCLNAVYQLQSSATDALECLHLYDQSTFMESPVMSEGLWITLHIFDKVVEVISIL